MGHAKKLRGQQAFRKASRGKTCPMRRECQGIIHILRGIHMKQMTAYKPIISLKSVLHPTKRFRIAGFSSFVA